MCHTQIREGKHRNGHTPALVSHWTGAVQFSVAFPGLSSSPPVPSAHSQHHLTFLQPLCPASPSSTSHLFGLFFLSPLVRSYYSSGFPSQP